MQFIDIIKLELIKTNMGGNVLFLALAIVLVIVYFYNKNKRR